MTHGTMLGVWCDLCTQELRLSRFSTIRCACGVLSYDAVMQDEDALDGWNSADLRAALTQAANV